MVEVDFFYKNTKSNVSSK